MVISNAVAKFILSDLSDLLMRQELMANYINTQFGTDDIAEIIVDKKQLRTGERALGNTCVRMKGPKSETVQHDLLFTIC